MRGDPWFALPVVVATAVIGALLSQFVGVTLMGFEKSPVSGVSLAVLVGLALGHVLRDRLRDGCTVTQAFATTGLQWGVALLGLKLSLAAAADLGLQALPVVASCIVVALLVVTGIGRLLALSRALVLLIAVGTSICGISAIAATAPLLRARAADVSYATAVITLFGLLALLVYPWLVHAALADAPTLAGIFLGTAVHDTSQVVGAALAYEQQFGAHGTLEAATLTKLLRNLSMVVVIPLVALAWRRATVEGARAGAAAAANVAPPRLPAVPWFLYAFLGLCALRTLVDGAPAMLGADAASAWRTIVAGAGTVSEWCFMLAMAAIGMQTNPASLRDIGLRPLVLGFVAALCVGMVSAGWIALR